HGRRCGAADWFERRVVRARIHRAHSRAACARLVRTYDAGAQVAHARAVQLRARRLPRPSGRGEGAVRHTRATHRVVARFSADVRRDPWHHDLTVPLLLAGGPERRAGRLLAATADWP